ncbi:hypothetical protein FBQ96_00300 [Nitrospirales bacterium NOB]|nr:hypothetical protein [Nitrospira sp.]MDL1888022.1 hypothetical protein [Nitrospirales bacterium NOB]MEB2337012.1 hypothetical protein [Nitrospirales bacterium]QOJ34612.1 MAG: hypothetical protein HRU82_06465 [Nitrospira sp.]
MSNANDSGRGPARAEFGWKSRRESLWCGVWLGLFLSGVMGLSACAPDSKYFQRSVNEATRDMVGKRHGSPHKVEPAPDGGEIWTYFERGSGTAGFSGQAHGGMCRSYVLTFDKQGVLRDWQQRSCRG